MSTRHYVFIVVLLLLGAGIGACAGFDLGDIIKVKTPNTIQQTTGLPSSTTLNEAQAEYEKWYQSVQTDGARWKANIERSADLRGMLSQLTLGAVDQAGPTLAGIPILGPSLPIVSGLVGLFLGRGNVRKEKEASYNAGIDKAADLIPPTKPA